MTKNQIFSLLLLTFFSFSFIAKANSPFKSYVDKIVVEEGESFTLNLEYTGRTNDMPDISPLNMDFAILSQSKAHQTSIINGASQSKTTWQLDLLPKTKSSKLIIPPLKLGSYQSGRIVVSVSNLPNKQTKIPGLELKASTDINEAYVNAEIILTIRLKTALLIKHGSLGSPEISDAIVEPLSEVDQDEVVEDGQRFYLFERKYAVFANKPGSLLIPSIKFEGRISERRDSFPSWPGFFDQGKKIHARSDELSINILDIPDSFPKDVPFLPAKSLAIIESFDQTDPTFSVGKATTRRFEIKASGVLGAFLPTLNEPKLDNIQIYVEPGQKVQKATPEGLLSSLKQSQVYMPSAGGNFVVPEQKIYWWNTEKNQLRIATTRELSFSVAHVANEQAAAPPKSDLPKEVPAIHHEIKKSTLDTKTTPWKILTILFLSLWIISLIGIFIWHKKSQKKKHKLLSIKSHDNTIESVIQKIISACAQNNAKETYGMLCELKTVASNKNRSDILAKLNDPSSDLHLAQIELEQALYGNSLDIDCKQCLKNISNLVHSLNYADKKMTTLAPMYPF